jgi:hypothetical protein
LHEAPVLFYDNPSLEISNPSTKASLNFDIISRLIDCHITLDQMKF